MLLEKEEVVRRGNPGVVFSGITIYVCRALSWALYLCEGIESE